jgi:hypothetical protein
MFCPHCGKEAADGQLFCKHCGARLSEETAPGPAPERAAAAGGREKTPWEDREALGFFGGLFKTLNGTLFRPSEFFKKMSVSGGLTDPLLFALIIGMVGLMSSYFWQIVLKSAMQDMVPGMGAYGGNPMLQGVGIALLAFLTPFFIIIGLFVLSGIFHVCLLLVKGATAGFEATFRVVSYGWFSAYLFFVLPVCGGIIGIVWAVVLAIIGLREAHETTGGKAAFAVFLPVIVCCGLVVIAVALFMGAAAASLGALMQMQK